MVVGFTAIDGKAHHHAVTQEPLWRKCCMSHSRPERGPLAIGVTGRFSTMILIAMLITGSGSAAKATSFSSNKATLPSPVPCPGCWHPALNTSWQWQLSGKVDQSINVTMYD